MSCCIELGVDFSIFVVSDDGTAHVLGWERISLRDCGGQKTACKPQVGPQLLADGSHAPPRLPLQPHSAADQAAHRETHRA